MRVWVFLVSLAMMLVVVAACGDDESEDSEAAESDTTEEVSEDPTATSEPEPTATAAPEPTSEPEPTEEETEAPDEESDQTEEGESDEQADDGGDQTEEGESDEQADDGEDRAEAAEQGESSGELDHLLLSLDDVPADWTLIETDEMVDDAEIDDLTEDPFEAPCGIEPLDEAFEPAADGQREFQGTEMGPFLTHGVAQLGSEDDAAASLDYMRQLFECDEWVETDEMGQEIVFEINESDIGDVGDDVVSMRISFNMGDEPEMEMLGDVGFDMVFFRRGEYISSIMYFDLFGMSEVDLPGLVQTADDKLASGI